MLLSFDYWEVRTMAGLGQYSHQLYCSQAEHHWLIFQPSLYTCKGMSLIEKIGLTNSRGAEQHHFVHYILNCLSWDTLSIVQLRERARKVINYKRK